MFLFKEIDSLMVLGWISLLAAFGLSLFFGGYADIIYAPSSLLLLATGLFAILPNLRTSTLNLPRGASALIIGLFWLYITVSLTWSTVPFVSLITYISFFSLPLIFFALSASKERESWITGAVITLLAALILLGGWATLQYLFLQSAYGTRAHHPLQNPNNLATLLNLGLLPFLAFLLYQQKTNARYWFAFAGALLLLSGLLATESRSGFLFFSCAIIVLAFTQRQHIKANSKKAVLLLASGCTLFALYHLAGSGHLTSRIGALSSAGTDGSVTSRLSLLRAAWEMFKDNPVGGSGLGTFYLYYPAYRAPFADNSAGNWVHLDVLQLVVETGFSAFILFYAAFIAILVRTVRALRATGKSSPERAAIAGLFCALLATALHSHTSFPLYVMPILIVCGVWLAAWYHVTALVLEKASYTSLALSTLERRSLFAAIPLATGIIALLVLSSAAGQHYLVKAHTAIRMGQVGNFLDYNSKARLYGPGSFVDPQVQLAGFYVDLLGSADILFSEEEQRTMFEDGLSLLAEAEGLNPVWAEIDFKRGRLFAATRSDIALGGQEMAQEAWKAALIKNPGHSRARMSLARVYITEGKVLAAYELLEKGLGFPLYPEQQKEIVSLAQQIAPLAKLQQTYREHKLPQMESSP